MDYTTALTTGISKENARESLLRAGNQAGMDPEQEGGCDRLRKPGIRTFQQFARLRGRRGGCPSKRKRLREKSTRSGTEGHDQSGSIGMGGCDYGSSTGPSSGRGLRKRHRPLLERGKDCDVRSRFQHPFRPDKTPRRCRRIHGGSQRTGTHGNAASTSSATGSPS